MSTPPLPTLESPRLRLRPYRQDDARAIYALYSDPVVTRYWSFPAWTRREQASDYLAARMALETPAVYAWALAERECDRLIGTTTLFSLSGPHKRAEIGYSLLPARQGQGLATEALRTVLEHAFGPLGLERIEADVDPRNEASWRLLEKLGFRREGLLRNRWRVDGEVCDSFLYGLLREDYAA
ncbi:MAG: GNAT family N-acetyltransferase [Rhizobium sp.]|nr:GNAT family N-acetyltransferase [Rhizobium sp.]